MTTPYHDLALEVLYGGKCTPSRHGLQYRKGKTIKDVYNAAVKARHPKNGLGKAEVELSMLEVYLQGVMKPLKKEKQ